MAEQLSIYDVRADAKALAYSTSPRSSTMHVMDTSFVRNFTSVGAFSIVEQTCSGTLFFPELVVKECRAQGVVLPPGYWLPVTSTSAIYSLEYIVGPHQNLGPADVELLFAANALNGMVHVSDRDLMVAAQASGMKLGGTLWVLAEAYRKSLLTWNEAHDIFRNMKAAYRLLPSSNELSDALNFA